jgi:mycofactocin biosynthetic radical S-adenosylmethionine protein MftC
LGMDMCGAAKMTCCLSPDGSLYPCAFLQEPEFLAGNIRETSLKEVWRHSHIFRRLRGLVVRSCEACYRFESCRGGCPAMAYYTHGDPAQPDPECLAHCISAKP